MGWTFDLSGDHPALDFANTLSERPSDAPIDRLPDYPALLAFAGQAGLLPAATVRSLARRAAASPEQAAAAVADARLLREAIYRIFAAVAGDQAPATADLEIFNRHLARLEVRSDLELGWCCSAGELDRPLGPIVVAALDLLTGAERRRNVRLCESDRCRWLFYDRSKNHSRRWCDMKQCGNRMKARRFYQKHRAS
jgi:predicted RNA-binding Zn ribbon-like protein